MQKTLKDAETKTETEIAPFIHMRPVRRSEQSRTSK